MGRREGGVPNQSAPFGQGRATARNVEVPRFCWETVGANSVLCDVLVSDQLASSLCSVADRPDTPGKRA